MDDGTSDELNVDLQKYYRAITTERVRCTRCNAFYYEIDNIGTWNCVQPAFTSLAVDSHSEMNPLILNRPIYVRADHSSDPMYPYMNHESDLKITVQFLSMIRSGVLSSKSLITVGLLFREHAGDYLNPNAPDLACLFGVRRYDHVAKSLANADRAFRFGHTNRPTIDDLKASTFVHPFMPNGILLEPVENRADGIFESNIRPIAAKYNIAFR